MTGTPGPPVAARLARRPPDPTLAWLREELEPRGRITRVVALRGGISHANHAVTLAAADGAELRVVLRRWVRPDWRASDPAFTPEQEVATYALLAASGVPAPRVLAADEAGARADVPAVVLSLVPGRPPNLAAPAGGRERLVRELARPLPLLHAIEPAAAQRTLPPYEPFGSPEEMTAPAWARSTAIWERAVAVVRSGRPPFDGVFIHRDYHPGNTLWVGDRLTAIVDWTSASLGPLAIDLAHMRVNLAVEADPALAEEFLEAHARLSGGAVADHDPAWDVINVLDFVSDFPDAEGLGPKGERLEAFLAGALARLG